MAEKFKRATAPTAPPRVPSLIDRGVVSPQAMSPYRMAAHPVPGPAPPQGQSLIDMYKTGMRTAFGPSPLSGDLLNPYSRDPEKRAEAYNSLAQTAMQSPLRVGVNPSKDIPGRILDMLENTALDPLKYRRDFFREVGRHQKPDRPLWAAQGRLETLGPQFKKELTKYFAPEEIPEAMEYLKAIDNWKTGYTWSTRQAMRGEFTDLGRSRRDPEWEQELARGAEKLRVLFNSSRYRSRGPTYRFSSMMGEFPSSTPRAGQTFFLEPTSWSSSPDWPRSGHWNSAWESTPLIMMEPGAKTLPIGGMISFPDQFEHFIAGLTKVEQATPKFVRLRQLEPIIPPRTQ